MESSHPIHARPPVTISEDRRSHNIPKRAAIVGGVVLGVLLSPIWVPVALVVGGGYAIGKSLKDKAISALSKTSLLHAAHKLQYSEEIKKFTALKKVWGKYKEPLKKEPLVQLGGGFDVLANYLLQGKEVRGGLAT